MELVAKEQLQSFRLGRCILKNRFLPLVQVHSDVSALICIFSHVWMAPLTVGSTVVALLGPLPYHLVLAVIESSRCGMLVTFGAINASYILQFITIQNLSWINKFDDRTVLLASGIASLLHCGVYLPELAVVSFCLQSSFFHLCFSEVLWLRSVPDQGAIRQVLRRPSAVSPTF